MKTDREASKCAVQSVDESDTVSAETMQRVRDLVEAAPDIRADRVAAAREALARGTLKLRGSDLVDKVLRSLVQE